MIALVYIYVHGSQSVVGLFCGREVTEKVWQSEMIPVSTRSEDTAKKPSVQLSAPPPPPKARHVFYFLPLTVQG